MNQTGDYEYFVCYYEMAAGDFAKMIYDTITRVQFQGKLMFILIMDR